MFRGRNSVIAMALRITTRRITTRSLKMAKPPMALATALITLAIFIMAVAPGTAFALRPVSRRHRILRHLRGILWNPLFHPSHDSLLRQNEEIDRLDLPRIQDDT